MIIAFTPLTFEFYCTDVAFLLISLMLTMVKRGNILFPEFYYDSLITQLSSATPEKSALSCRLLALNTGYCREQFVTPKIFHFLSQYKILDSQAIILPLRKSLDDGIYAAFIKYGRKIDNLRLIYSLICSLMVTDESNVDAAKVILLLLKIQKHALESGQIPAHSNPIHATIASCLTLFCWIHRGENMLNYVKKILEKRSAEAPHLLPPLKLAYRYASHHVRWNHKPLFFDGWELRYALWKIFVTKNDVLPMPHRG